MGRLLPAKGSSGAKADEERIATRRSLVAKDPKHEVALYTLGSELLEAGQAEEAAVFFRPRPT